MILYTYIYDDLLDHLIYLIYPSELGFFVVDVHPRQLDKGGF